MIKIYVRSQEITLCLFFLLLLTFIAFGECYEYCKDGKEEQLCKKMRHIVCYPQQLKEWSLTPEAQVFGQANLREMVPMTTKLRCMFRDLHNSHRNEISCGRVKDNSSNYFLEASRMRLLIWDDELEFLAHKHAENCVFEHDQCRATDRFKYAGQNLSFLKTTYEKTVKFVLRTALDGWYGEAANVVNGKELTEKYPPAEVGETGHLTVAANDHVSRLGCAISSCLSTNKTDVMPYVYITTCVYDWTNLGVRKSYQAGSPTSECDYWKQGKSATYECLCGNDGNLNTQTRLRSVSDDDDVSVSASIPDRPEEPNQMPQEDYEQLWCSTDIQNLICPTYPENYHIVCHPEMHNASNDGVVLIKSIEMTKDLRTLILDLHSQYRNEIACGQIQDNHTFLFPKASRQRVLMWDWELAYTAETHAKQCLFKNDLCRNTLAYLYAGQNLGVNHIRADTKRTLLERAQHEIKGNIKFWFNQHKNVLDAENFVNNFSRSDQVVAKGGVVSHFVQLAQDYNSRIGCAISQCFLPERNTSDHKFRAYRWLFTCNYDMAAIIDQPIYEIGASPGDNCEYWGDPEISTEYPCLCKNNGKYKQFRPQLKINEN